VNSFFYFSILEDPLIHCTSFPLFAAPEMCDTESTGFSGYAADLWAAGVCLYVFTTGKVPFFSLTPTKLFGMISNGEVEYEGLGLSNVLKDLLGKLLDKDPSTRAGVGTCLKHKFCADARAERLAELGHEMSDKHIILSKNDVDMALSVTMPNRKVLRTHATAPAAPRRTTAPANTFKSSCAEAVSELPAIATTNDTKMTANLTVTPTDDEGKAYLSDNSATSNGSTPRTFSFKKVGIKAKFKLKDLWKRRK